MRDARLERRRSIRSTRTSCGSHPRRLRVAGTSSDSRDVFDDLPQGSYHLAAISGGDLREWQDADNLIALSDVAERVTVGAAVAAQGQQRPASRS